MTSTAARRPVKQRFRVTLSQRRAMYGWLYISPWIVGFLAFMAYPLGYSFWLSFRQLESLAGLKSTWVGIKNYTDAFLVDTKFVPIFVTAFRDIVLDTPVILTFSLAVALLVHQKISGKGVFRVILFLPVIVGSGVVVGRLFEQGVGAKTSILATRGVADWILYSLGPEAADSIFALLQRLTLILWRSGVQILIFIAALHGLPVVLYDAGRCDGGSDWQLFWKITLPMITPILWLNVVYTVVDGLANVFNPMITYIYNKAFGVASVGAGGGNYKLGYAASLGWIYLAEVFAVVLVFLVLSNRYSFYAGER